MKNINKFLIIATILASGFSYHQSFASCPPDCASGSVINDPVFKGRDTNQYGWNNFQPNSNTNITPPIPTNTSNPDPSPTNTPPAGSLNAKLCSGVQTFKTLSDIVNFFTCFILRSIIPLLFAGALGLFVFGVVKYFMHANDSKERAEGSKFMLWGIVALAVMISVWGLVSILTNTFGISFAIPLLSQ